MFTQYQWILLIHADKRRTPPAQAISFIKAILYFFTAVFAELGILIIQFFAALTPDLDEIFPV